MKRRFLAMVLAIASLTLTSCGSVVSTQTDATVAAATPYYTTIQTKGTTYMYDFGTSRNYGATSFRGDNIDFEGYFGARLDTSDGIKYSVYNHSKKVSASNVKLNLYKADDNDKLVKSLTSLSIKDQLGDSEWKSINDKLEDGLYRVESKWVYTPDNSNDYVSGYIYVKDGKAQTCRVRSNTMGIHEDKFDKLLAANDTDPKHYLSNAKNTYPSNGSGNSCVHRKEWEAKADEIIKERHLENASDEAKVFFFTEWLAKNIAYDEWRVTVNKNQTRANYYGNWHDDNLFSYYNHVGQCWDFVNMMALMCRHAGIPCTDISNDAHTITCVYMHGEWLAIDITLFTRHTNWEEKPDPAKFVDGEWNYRMADYYGYRPNDMDAWEECIWEAKNNQR
ncbi:MAG: transglutaminase-like domain-containing protein [Lachnospiraceae bacterium]|nr:transglutaminase-like domain-containing protein [Lachnospiraceae bacterium]